LVVGGGIDLALAQLLQLHPDLQLAAGTSGSDPDS